MPIAQSSTAAGQRAPWTHQVRGAAAAPGRGRCPVAAARTLRHLHACVDTDVGADSMPRWRPAVAVPISHSGPRGARRRAGAHCMFPGPRLLLRVVAAPGSNAISCVELYATGATLPEMHRCRCLISQLRGRQACAVCGPVSLVGRCLEASPQGNIHSVLRAEHDDATSVHMIRALGVIVPAMLPRAAA
jgi:hypothetical protein